MEIREKGRINTDLVASRNTEFQLNLTEPLTSPVIILLSTQRGYHPLNLRIVDQILDAYGNTVPFSFCLKETQVMDGTHTYEDFDWLSVKAGV
jgi:hypothetical protein